MKTGCLWQRGETSRSTEQDPLKGEDDDLETDVIFDQPETVSESQRHLLALSPADQMQNGSATNQATAASGQVALAATAKEEATISHHEPKVEVSSIPVTRAARKEPVLLGDISTVSSTNIETKPPQHPPLNMDTGVRIFAPGNGPFLHTSSALFWMYIAMHFPCSFFIFIGSVFDATQIPTVSCHQYAR